MQLLLRWRTPNLEESGQLGVAERDVLLLPVRQFTDDSAQRSQAPIDKPCFFNHFLIAGPRLRQSLRALRRNEISPII
jgi:hypothetical protein